MIAVLQKSITAVKRIKNIKPADAKPKGDGRPDWMIYDITTKSNLFKLYDRGTTCFEHGHPKGYPYGTVVEMENVPDWLDCLARDVWNGLTDNADNKAWRFVNQFVKARPDLMDDATSKRLVHAFMADQLTNALKSKRRLTPALREAAEAAIAMNRRAEAGEEISVPEWQAAHDRAADALWAQKGTGLPHRWYCLMVAVIDSLRMEYLNPSNVWVWCRRAEGIDPKRQYRLHADLGRFLLKLIRENVSDELRAEYA